MQQRMTAEWARSVLRPRPGDPFRLLIEDPAGEWFGAFGHYRARGFEVAVCTGPCADGSGCPVLADERCRLRDEADVVITALDPDDQHVRRLVDLTQDADPPSVAEQPGTGTIDSRTRAATAALTVRGLASLWAATLR